MSEDRCCVSASSKYGWFTKKGLYGDKLVKIREKIAWNRMSKGIKNFELSGEAQNKFKDVFQKFSKETFKCLMVKSRRNAIWPCFNCLFRDDDDAHLVRDLSLTSIIVLTEIVPKHSCRWCKIADIIESKECLYFLLEHKMSSESHRHLLRISDLDTLEGTCIILQHEISAKVPCVRWIQRIFSTSVDYYTTPFSSLLDASELSTKKTLKLLEKTLHCHTNQVCRKIQMVPHSFCSEHKAFINTTPSEPQTQFSKPSTIHIISEHIIPVGLWPPSSQ